MLCMKNKTYVTNPYENCRTYYIFGGALNEIDEPILVQAHHVCLSLMSLRYGNASIHISYRCHWYATVVEADFIERLR